MFDVCVAAFYLFYKMNNRKNLNIFGNFVILVHIE